MYKKWLWPGIRSVAVLVGIIVLTSFAIDASDTFRGNSGTLTAQLLGGAEESACPLGMVHLATSATFSCVDAYEASAEINCPFPEINDELATIANITSSNCTPESKPTAQPWRFVSREQASLLCARADKRLPNSAEWYGAAIGTPDDARCAIDSSGPSLTGSRTECISAPGIYDAVGNVWEWTNDDVFDGVYSNRTLPPEGYVAQVASDGVATETSEEPVAQFGTDYLWRSEAGSFGIIRGGFYGSKEDAGVYAVHAKTLPTTIGGAIGFRCVR